jgi:hypothetical protein
MGQAIKSSTWTRYLFYSKDKISFGPCPGNSLLPAGSEIRSGWNFDWMPPGFFFFSGSTIGSFIVNGFQLKRRNDCLIEIKGKNLKLNPPAEEDAIVSKESPDFKKVAAGLH